MTAPRTGRRVLGRIIAGSLALTALTFPVAPAAAAATPGGPATAAALVPQQDPDGDGGTGGGNDGGGTGGGNDGGGTGGGNDGGGTGGGNNDGGGALDPSPNRPPAQQNPTQDREAEEARKRAEEEAKRQREAEEAAREAAEDRAEAAARARREAAERAEQARKARESWASRDRPHQMITVRRDRIEIVDNGRLISLVPKGGGTLTLSELDRMAPNDWVTNNGGTVTLDAAVVLTPGATMKIGPDIKTVRLTGGPELSDASPLYTGGGRLTLEGVTISSIDPATQQPLPFEAKGRPFIETSRGGELNATDTTITDMGVPEIGQEGARPAVSFNPGSSGSLVRTTLDRNNIGVELSHSEGVKLDGLTVKGSDGDGLVLNGDLGTTMAGIVAEANGGNGVSVGGDTTDRPITGITTRANHMYGIVVAEQKGAQVTGVTTEADEAGGLRLNQAVDVTVTDFTAIEQPIGIFTHVSSTGVVLDGITMTGGRRGVVVEKSTTNLELRNSTIEGSRVAAVNLGGKHLQVNGVQVTDSKAGVRVERGAEDIQLNAMTIEGGRDGVVASGGTKGIVINDLVVNHVRDDGIRSESTGMQINGGTITGGSTGIDVSAGATIRAITINGASEGIRSRSKELVRAENIAIDTIDLGLNIALGCPFLLSNSTVHALEALRGQILPEGQNNNFSLPPLNLLGAIGVPLILLAIVLEQIHSFRQRKVGGNKRRVPPAIPVGAG